MSQKDNVGAAQLKEYLRVRKGAQILNPDKFNGLTYKFGSILFQINADTGTFATDRLEKFKMAQDNLNSQIPDQKYFSELKTINNNKVVFATMEYKKEDESKAEKILDYFLKNLKFKD
ncbi:MAG: hypothetical protein EOO42_16320 [Flavobacteriales bacterium]|nr:MAG: hypothetical protein EOO42_16320 [Flavobacteriales bacterium]